MRSSSFLRSGIFVAAGVVSLSVLLVQVGPAQQRQGLKKEVKPQPSRPASRRAIGRSTAATWPATRFSPLTQINTRNVAQLKEAWTFRPPAPPPSANAGKGPAPRESARERPRCRRGRERRPGRWGGGGGSAEVTPVVVNGVMYLPAGPRVVALEADSGKEIWSYNAPGAVANRAVGYWSGDTTNPPRVLFTTGSKLMALECQHRQGRSGLRQRRQRRDRDRTGAALRTSTRIW